MRLPKRLTLEMIEHISADAVMVNLALLTAFALRFLSFFVLGVGPEGGGALQTCILAYLQTYSGLFWLLTFICLIAFYLSGFYTHGRVTAADTKS